MPDNEQNIPQNPFAKVTQLGSDTQKVPTSKKVAETKEPTSNNPFASVTQLEKKKDGQTSIVPSKDGTYNLSDVLNGKHDGEQLPLYSHQDEKNKFELPAQQPSNEEREPVKNFEGNKLEAQTYLQKNNHVLREYFQKQGTYDKDFMPFYKSAIQGNAQALKKAHEIIDGEIDGKINALKAKSDIIQPTAAMSGMAAQFSQTYMPQPQSEDVSKNIAELEKQKVKIQNSFLRLAAGNPKTPEGKYLEPSMIGSKLEADGFGTSKEQAALEAKADKSKTHWADIGRQHADFRKEGLGYQVILDDLQGDYDTAVKNYKDDNSEANYQTVKKIEKELNDKRSEYNNLDLKYPEVAKQNLAKLITDKIADSRNRFNPLNIIRPSLKEVKSAFNDLFNQYPEMGEKYNKVFMDLVLDKNMANITKGEQPIATGGFSGALGRGLDEVAGLFGYMDKWTMPEEDVAAKQLSQQYTPQRPSFQESPNQTRIVVDKKSGSLVQRQNNLSNTFDNVVNLVGEQAPTLVAFGGMEGIVSKTVGKAIAGTLKGATGLLGEVVEAGAGIQGGAARQMTKEAFNLTEGGTGQTIQHVIAMQGAQFGMSYARNYDESLLKFEDTPEGHNKATTSATLKTMAEGLAFSLMGVSPSKMLGGTIKSAIDKDLDEFITSTDFSKLSSKGISNKVYDIIYPKLEKLIPSTVKESLKMGGVSSVNAFVKEKIDNYISGQESEPTSFSEEAKKQVEIFKDGALMGAVFSAIPNLFSMTLGGKDIAPSHSETLMNLSLNPEASKYRAQKLFEKGTIDGNRRNEFIKVINTAQLALHNAVESARNKNVNFDNLKPDAQQKLVLNHFRQQYFNSMAKDSKDNPELKERALAKKAELEKEELGLLAQEKETLPITDDFVSSLGIKLGDENGKKIKSISDLQPENDYFIDGKKVNMLEAENHIYDQAVKTIDTERFTDTDAEVLRNYEKRIKNDEKLSGHEKKEFEELKTKKADYDKQQKFINSVKKQNEEVTDTTPEKDSRQKTEGDKAEADKEATTENLKPTIVVGGKEYYGNNHGEAMVEAMIKGEEFKDKDGIIPYDKNLTKDELLKLVQTDERFKNWRGENGKFKDIRDEKQPLLSRDEAGKKYGIRNSEELSDNKKEELKTKEQAPTVSEPDVEAKKKELKNIELGLTDRQHILLAAEGEPIATVGNVSKIGVGNDTKIELTKEEQKEVDKYFKAYNKNLIDDADFNKWRKDFSDRVLSRRKAEVEQSLKEQPKETKSITPNTEEDLTKQKQDKNLTSHSKKELDANDIITGKKVFERFSQNEQRGFAEGGTNHVEASLLLAADEGTGGKDNATPEAQENRIETFAKDISSQKQNTDGKDKKEKANSQTEEGSEANDVENKGDEIKPPLPPVVEGNDLSEHRSGWVGIQKSMLGEAVMNVMGELPTVTNKATIEGAVNMLSGMAENGSKTIMDASKEYTDNWHDKLFEKNKDGSLVREPDGSFRIKKGIGIPTELLGAMGVRQAYLSDMMGKTTDLTEQSRIAAEMNKVDEILRVAQNQLGRGMQFLQTLFKMGDDGKIMFERNKLSKIVDEDIPQTKEDLEKKLSELDELGEKDKASQIKEAYNIIEDLKTKLKEAKEKSDKAVENISNEAFDAAIKEAEERGKKLGVEAQKSAQKKGKSVDSNGKIVRAKANELADKVKAWRESVEGKGQLSADPLLLRTATGAALRLVEGSIRVGGRIAEIIEDAILKIRNDDRFKDVDENELRSRIHTALVEVGLDETAVKSPTLKKSAIDEIKKISEKEKTSSLTKEMADKDYVKNIIESHLGKGLKSDEILDAAHKDLKEVLPDVTKQQMLDAYLHKGDFEKETRVQAEDKIKEQRKELMEVSNLERENELLRRGDEILKDKTKKDKISSEVIDKLKAERELLLKPKKEAELQRRKEAKDEKDLLSQKEQNELVKQQVADIDNHLKTWDKILKSADKNGSIISRMKEENRQKIDDALLRQGIKLDRNTSDIIQKNRDIATIHNSKVDELLQTPNIPKRLIDLLNDLKVKNINDAEDLGERITRKANELQVAANRMDRISPASREIRNKILDLKNELVSGLKKTNEEIKLNSAKQKMRGDINKMKRDIAGERFVDMKPSVQLKIDREFTRLNYERNKIRAEYDKKEENFLYKNKSLAGKAVDMGIRFRRGSLISSIKSTMTKLPLSALTKIGSDMFTNNITSMLAPHWIAKLTGLDKAVERGRISWKADLIGLKTTSGFGMSGIQIDEALLKKTKEDVAANKEILSNERKELLKQPKSESRDNKVKEIDARIKANDNAVQNLKVKTLLESTDKARQEASKNLFDAMDIAEKIKEDKGENSKEFKSFMNKEYADAKKSWNEAEFNSDIAFTREFIGKVWENRKEQIQQGAHGFEEAMGDFKRMTYADRMAIHSTKFGKVAETSIYLVDYVGRVHAATKDVSAMKQFMEGYAKRIEKEIEKRDAGNPLTEAEKWVIMQKSYDMDFKGGKYSEKNIGVRFIQDMSKNIDRLIEQGLSKRGALGKGQVVVGELGRSILLPVLKIPANIANSGIFKFTVGFPLALGRIASEAAKVIDISDRKQFVDDIQHFGENFTKHMESLDPEYADKIMEGLNKGFVGGTLATVAMHMVATGALAWGGVYTPGQHKKKDKFGNELPYGSFSVNGHVYSNYATKVLSHLPEMMPIILGANAMMAYEKQEKLDDKYEYIGKQEKEMSPSKKAFIVSALTSLDETPFKNITSMWTEEGAKETLDNSINSFFSVSLLRDLGSIVDDINGDERDIKTWNDRTLTGLGLNFLVDKKQNSLNSGGAGSTGNWNK